jgi:Na+/H+-dicarboxylate symporter
MPREISMVRSGRRGVNPMIPGKVTLGTLVFILVLVVAFYLGTMFIPPYWSYLSMQDPVKEAAMLAVSGASEATVRADIMRRAREQDLKLTEENIDIAREDGTLVVRVAWVARVELPRKPYDLSFRIEQRVPLR